MVSVRNLFMMGSAIAAISAPMEVSAQAQTYQLDIPAQSLDSALRAFAQSTRQQIVFDMDAVRGRTSPALRGNYTINDAIGILLANSGLEASPGNSGVYIVKQKASRPVARIAAAQTSTQASTQQADAGQVRQAPPARTVEPTTEIVVTARRRDELLTGVPASITAYSSDFLEKQNIQTFADYATKIPNVTFQYGQGSDFAATGFSGGRVTTIRGVAGANTTAYYLNDTPIPSTVSPQTLGLDRIEVLKGPQGTLFGASSMGGNLRFITRKPSLTKNSFMAEGQIGTTKSGGTDYGIEALGGAVLVPDVMAVDVSLGYTRESGFLERRFPDPAAPDQFITKDDQGRNDVLSGSVALRTRLSDSFEVTLNALGQKAKLNGYPAAYVPLPGYAPVSYTLTRDRDIQEYSKDRWGLASIVLDYEGDGFSVVSSTSYFARRVEEQEDVTEGTNEFLVDFFEVDLNSAPFTGLNIIKDKRFTHETRLSFDEGVLIPNLSGIVGVFHQEDDQTFTQPAVFIPELADAGFEPAYLSDFSFPQHVDNTAVFGELYYEILPKLTLTLGLRQYWIKQKADEFLSLGFFNSPEGDITPAESNKQSGLVPKFVASYEIGDGGNIYASVSKGFRVGGTQPAQTDDFCVPELNALGLSKDAIGNFQPDTLWSYELGAKARLAGGRLSVSSAVFQIDWSDVQQTIFLPDCSISFITNAGKARIRGGELEVSGRPIASVPLTVQLGLGYTNGKLVEPGFLPQSPNSRLAQVPRFTGTISGYYRTPVSDSADLFAAADYSYTSAVKVADNVGGFLTRQPFNLLNANIGLGFDRAEVLIYGKNLLDKRLNFGDLYANGFERQELTAGGDVQRLPRGAVSRPREIGLQVRLNF
ncbi:TonB-dependent receptor domain-containing protein [Aurantiacibacter rhizosphaerae]|uniref:TonB-dependent receptor n=1 Tax=Aurantiacibacter rhizosphaerae TaxID=2691582 RepID=A0A844XAX8_9SPHN|nr:TonB-dependent receptor [Aurantiacibacter rhizosphaerae]MWV27557.1 TonB-dependent receptor [Aurantiacibacter rhizosphaerae]